MRYEPPRRIYWVQVKDALEHPDSWTRGRVSCEDGEDLLVLADTGQCERLTCHKSGLHAILDAGLEHEDGGRIVFWSSTWRLLAIPLAEFCEDGADGIRFGASAVIIEKGRSVDIGASDSTWRMRLFAAVSQGVEPLPAT